MFSERTAPRFILFTINQTFCRTNEIEFSMHLKDDNTISNIVPNGAFKKQFIRFLFFI